jgi:hypothetical protein
MSILKRPNIETPWVPTSRTENSWIANNQHYIDVWLDKGRLLSNSSTYSEDQLTVTTTKVFIDMEAVIDWNDDTILTEIRLERDAYFVQSGMEIISHTLQEV